MELIDFPVTFVIVIQLYPFIIILLVIPHSYTVYSNLTYSDII